MKSLFLGILLPALLVIAGIALVVLLRAPEPARTALPNPNDVGALLGYLPIAEVAEVKPLADTLDLEVSGTVEPFREIQLAAEVAGRIVEKDPQLRSGNYVQQGQVLFRIDPRDYELEIERLQRIRDQEQAAIVELPQEIDNSQELLEVAEQQLELSEADVKRVESMNKSFSSASELDEARRSRLSALNQKVTLQNQVRTAETRRSRLVSATKLAETEIDRAELDLQRTVVRAPVNGRVVREEVEVDSYVQGGTLLTVIEDTSKVEVACSIRMDQLSWIMDQPSASADSLVNAAARAARSELPQTPVEISYSIAGRESSTFIWDGRLDRIEGVGLEKLSRTVPIRIRVDNPGEFRSASGKPLDLAGPPILVRGMFVDVVIKTRPSGRLMLVPKLSIKPATNSSVIWKFAKNPEVVRSTPKAREAIEAYEKAGQGGASTERLASHESAKNDEASEPDANRNSVVNPEEWDAGNLQIVEDVRLISAYWGENELEYWVCEVESDELSVGDRVIISPLPGVRADGSDPVRVRREKPPTDLAHGGNMSPLHHEG